MPRFNDSVVVVVNVTHNIVPVEVKVAVGGSRDPLVSFRVGQDVHNHPGITVLVRRANIAIDARRDGGSRTGTFQKYGGRALASRFNLY